jgi:hypothetical protein
MPVSSASKFERFFREAASLDVDKDDLKRYSDFINRKLYELLVVAQATAAANRRDIMEPFDLPITKGLQQSIEEFERLDTQIDLKTILERLTTWPPLDVSLSAETEARLPLIAGGLSVALARAFKILKPDLPNPQTAHWEQAFRVFDLLL